MIAYWDVNPTTEPSGRTRSEFIDKPKCAIFIQKFGYLGPKVIFCMVIVIFVNQYARGYNFPIRTTPKNFRFRAIWKREPRSNCPRDYAPKGSLVALVPSFYILNFPIKVRFPLLVFMYGGCFPFSPSSGQFDWETWHCLELGGRFTKEQRGGFLREWLKMATTTRVFRILDSKGLGTFTQVLGHPQSWTVDPKVKKGSSLGLLGVAWL